MRTREEITARIALVRELRDANEALTESLRGADERMRLALENEGLETAQVSRYLAEFQSVIRLDLIMRIRDADREACDATIRMLQLLHDQFDHWQHIPGSEYVFFRYDATAMTYNRYIIRVEQAVARQEALQQQFVSGL